MATEELLGTFAWCERKRCSLTLGERASLVRMMVLAELRDVFERSPFGMGIRRRAHAIAESFELDVPDSALCSDALRRAEEVLPTPLLVHSLRSYHFGLALASVDGHTLDREVVFVASMFHDFGLAPLDSSSLGASCFATEGARIGASFARQRGLDAATERSVYQAISLHLHPYVDVSTHGAEARYLADGATLDVIGSRRHLLPSSLFARVHEVCPRHGFREEILAGMQVPHAPGTRAAFLLRLGFAALAKRCPLDDAR